MQRLGVKLCQHIDLPKTVIEAIANRNVYQAVFAGQRHRWFSSFFGEGKQSGAGTAAHDDGKGIFRCLQVHNLLWRPRLILDKLFLSDYFSFISSLTAAVACSCLSERTLFHFEWSLKPAFG